MTNQGKGKFLIIILLSVSLAGFAEISYIDFDIKPDCQKDQAGKIQRYLDFMASKKGGTAYLPAGKYILQESLVIPTSVTLEGSWQMPHHGIKDKGTVFYAYPDRGNEAGKALVTLTQSSAIKGVTILYPEQSLDDIEPYPWTIKGTGMHNVVENVTLANSYNGICIGPENNELHFIHNVYGCVLRRGIFIDNTTDIGRIENVHFNPHFWPRSTHKGVPEDAKPNPDIAVAKYMNRHLQAFILGRTDWQYVTNTFVFGAKTGYLFKKTDNGVCNGQFSGIGADMNRTCVYIENTPPYGILINNGQFVPGNLVKEDSGVAPVAILTSKEFTGKASFSNCAFWGPPYQALVEHGKGFVSVANSLVKVNSPDKPIFELQSGSASLRNLHFDKQALHIFVGPDIKRAIISENFAPKKLVIKNLSGDKVISSNNP
jgi:hypothetical protein